MPRRTKIVATVGPSCESESVLAELIEAGVNVFRLNLSHGQIEQHVAVSERIRRQARKQGRHLGILVDLQGPKIRISGFRDNAVELVEGNAFALDLEVADEEGTARGVGLEYRELCAQLKHDDILLLDDGRIRLQVDAVKANRVETRVIVGGTLGSRKGINRLGGGLAAAALTHKDITDIESLSGLKPDFVAVSFVASAADMEQTRALLAAQGLAPALIAKIERADVVNDEPTLRDIIAAASGIMVARGDLGVEVGDASLIGIQKALISRARKMDRVVITATQMMESMVSNAMPTRAEVFDVANAVLDGTDAVMLSAETAIGDYPVEVVRAMVDTCLGAEQHPSTRTSGYRVEREFSSAQETIAMAAIYAANRHAAVRGIACLTESGKTPLLMSRLSSGRPIFALSSKLETLQRLCLCRGVVPLFFDAAAVANEEVDAGAIDLIKHNGFLHSGDAVILTRGIIAGRRGNTNIMQILPVP